MGEMKSPREGGAGPAFLERVGRGEVLVGDGAIGTQLQAEGLEPGAAPEGIHLRRPEILARIASRYLEAGADVLTTNTFGASPLKLARHGLEDRTEEINRRGVEIVLEVARGRAYVSASVGPTGAILEPYGETPEEEVSAAFRRQIQALVAGGPDLLCIETMTDLREAVLAVRTARSAAPDLPLMVTMTFEETPRGFYTLMGNSVADVATGLEEAGADLLGTNCGAGIETMGRIAREVVHRSRLPVAVQSNAGLPEVRNGVVTYPESPDLFARHAAEMAILPVALVGGCCGTGPEHVRAVRAAVSGVG
jgi:5-methyltetrahydrofolate--homocysteine methyltransferase